MTANEKTFYLRGKLQAGTDDFYYNAPRKLKNNPPAKAIAAKTGSVT